MFKFLSQRWLAIAAGPKASWEETAEQKAISPFNAYISYNQFRYRNFLSPSKAHPAAEVQTIPTLPTITATAGVRQITVAITKGATGAQWGWAIFRSPTTTFTPSYSNHIASIVIDAGGNGTYVDTPLGPGTYWYHVRGISEDGVWGADSTEANATVT
jgi:hypothetical protein